MTTTLQLQRPRLWRMSVSRYDRLTEFGWFDDHRVELIEGKVIRMPAQAEPHVAAVSLAARAITGAFGSGYYVRVQAPLVQGRYSKPEPDAAVVPGTERDYLKTGTPASALLVIEVSDSTLTQDRGRKAAIYAGTGILDYWIVNLIDRQLEVHRNPISDRNLKWRFRYADVKILKPTDSVAPLAVPHAIVRVSDLLP
jgi:Uma2 family endonuclease